MNKLKQAIISKIHGLPWEEAKWKEAEIKGCKYEHVWPPFKLTEKSLWIPANIDEGHFARNKKIVWDTEYDDREFDDDAVRIIGSPITLSRVLQALTATNKFKEVNYIIDYGIDCSVIQLITWEKPTYRILIPFNCILKDKSTATLEDQSEETILALTKIFL